MILSDKHIKERIRDGSLVIEPFDEECVQPSTYDVHLSQHFRIFKPSRQPYIDLRNKESITELIEIDDEGFILHPNEFVLAATVERFKIPHDLAAKLEGKSSTGRVGLVIHATAGYIDPGFEGQITYEMSNLNSIPIKLTPGIRVAQICFFQMSSVVERPYGTAGNKYQGQMGPTESRVWEDFK